MYNNVLELNENASSYLSDLNLSCRFAMDDGGRCLLDVINDPLLLQSFLESGSDDNSKDPQDGTSSESAVESPQISRNNTQALLSNHISSGDHIVDSSEMCYTYPSDSQGLMTQNTACSINTGLGGGMTLVVASSPAGTPLYQHASSSGATIHHMPTSISQTVLHQHSSASARSVTPLSHNIRSPSQGPPSVHSMPPPSPLQQTRSPLPPHTPSPAPPWSPAPPVLSPASGRVQSSMPSVAFQQSHNQILQTSNNVTQIVTALASQQSVAQKLNIQQQQQQQQHLVLHPQLSPISSQQQQQQQQPTRLSAVGSPVITTSSVSVTPSMVQIIPAPQPNVPLPVRTSHSTVRPIQPKLPQQILPKPVGTVASQFVSPVVKQTTSAPVTASQRGVGVGIQAGSTGQLVINQGQPGVFPGPQGTFVLNQIIPGVGSSPILIQGNIANLSGLQLTLRPQTNVSSNQTLTSAGTQSNPTLIAALQGPNQPAQTIFTQTKSPIHGPPAIVIPNNLATAGLTSQNLNLTTTAIQNNTLVPSVTQGQGFLTRSNIIFSPRVVGPNHGLQLQQIQTPQGPIFAFASSPAIALPHLQTALQNAALGNPQLSHGTVPMHGVVTGQNVISGLSLQSHPSHAALQQQPQHHQPPLLGAAVPFTSHLEQPAQQVVPLPQPIPPQHSAAMISSHTASLHVQQHQHAKQDSSSPKAASPQKPIKGPTVNLEELLKEHGIVPENSPTPSPDSQSPPEEQEQVPTPLQSDSSIMQSSQLVTALQSQHQVVMEQLSQNPAIGSPLPHLKLAFTQDGNFIIHPHPAFIPTPRLSQSASVGQGSKVPSTTVFSTANAATPVSVPLVTTQSCTARGHSTLLARLKAAPAINVPDVVTSVALATSMPNSSTSVCTSSSITTTTITTTSTALIPLTVQSLHVSSSPISTSHVVHPVNLVSVVSCDRTSTVDVSSTSSCNVNFTTSAAVTGVTSSQNVQSKLNHVIFGFPSIIGSNVQLSGPAVQSAKTATSTAALTSGSNSQMTTSKAGSDKVVKVETRIVGHSEHNNSAIAASRKLQTAPSVVPNEIIQKIQKEISDLLVLKHRTPEQEKSLQYLLMLQEKVCIQQKTPCQSHQLNRHQVNHVNSESEKLLSSSTISGQSSVLQKRQMDSVVTEQSNSHVEKQNTSNQSQSLHLVNLLKQGPTQNAQHRFAAPSSTSSSTLCDSTTPTSHTVTSHIRVGNQIVTLSQPKHSAPHHVTVSSESSQVQESGLHRVQQPSQQSSSSHPNIIHLKAKSPLIRLNSVPKIALIKKQLTVDQNYALSPDVVTPFSSVEDACSRLLKYHVFNTKVPSFKEIEKADETFSMVSGHLLDKFKRIVNDYQKIVLKESMRPFPPGEDILLMNLFTKDESESLQQDKDLVAEGKSLHLPPPPPEWFREFDDSSDTQNVEEQDISIKEDRDDLEAPVIDSCIDVSSPHPDNDDDCYRSPPTLKRIVIKSEKTSDDECDELPSSRKRLKVNHFSIKTECSEAQWTSESSSHNIHLSKLCDKEIESINTCKNNNIKCENFHRDNREEDIMSKIRKELNISPLENDDENETEMTQVDFDPPGGANGLADFEPPVARTEEPCTSTILSSYSNGVRTRAELKYDFDMLGCTSEWVEAYANHASQGVSAESEAAVESILNDHHNPPDLDLSGIEGLDDHLVESTQNIPNGVRDEDSRDSDLSYIGYHHIPKSRSYEDECLMVESESHSCDMQDHQVQSAIKSILEMQSENRSYFDSDTGLMRMYELEKSTDDPCKHYSSLDTDMGVTSGEHDAALDEAVRSIMQ